MIDLVVKVNAAHVPAYGDMPHFGLLTSAVPHYKEAAEGAEPPTLTELTADINRATRVWWWTWDGLAVWVVKVDGAGTILEGKVVLVERVDPTSGQSTKLVAEVKTWLDASLATYMDFVKSRGPKKPDEALLDAVEFHAAPDDPKHDQYPDGTPPSILAFVANLTTVMAPVPQIGGLTHIAKTKPNDLPQAADTFLVFAPLFTLKWDDVTTIKVTEKDLSDAVPKVGDPLEPKPEIKIKVPDGVDYVVLRCVALPSTPPATKVVQKWLSADTLWSDAHMKVGNRAGFRRIVGGGFDLLDPALGAVDDFGLVTEPVGTFELGARLVRDQVLADVPLLEKCLRAVQAQGDDTGTMDVKAAYETFRTDILTDTKDARKGWREAIQTTLATIEDGATTPVEAPEPPRTLTAGPEPGFPKVTLRVPAKDSLCLIVDAPPEAGATYTLQSWDAATATWLVAGIEHLAPEPTVGAPKPKQFEVDLSAAAAGLRAGRYQLLMTPPVVIPQTAASKVVARFHVTADEAALAPLHRLAAALSTPEGHSDIVIGVLRYATKNSPDAQRYLAHIEGRLAEELAGTATRTVIREDNLRDRITTAITGTAALVAAMADANANFTTAVKAYAAVMLAQAEAPDKLPAWLYTAIDTALKSHADGYLAATAPLSDDIGVTATPAPLEIEVEAPVADDPDFDKNDADPLAWIAGVAVLLRRYGEAPWRCLNAAKLPKVNATGIVPLPVAYEDGVASATIRYDGIPLAARGGLSSKIHTLTPEDGGPLAEPIAQYEPSYEPSDDESIPWALPLMLADGKKYQAHGFAIHQTGVLPKEIADENAPWRPDSSKLGKTILGIPFTHATYKRTVAVGAPRLELATGKGHVPLTDPAFRVPPGVTPLADDLVRTAVTLDGPARTLFDDPAALPLADGPWSLTIEGIEPRGFDGAATLRIVPRGPGRELKVELRVRFDATGLVSVWSVNDTVSTKIAEADVGGRPATVSLAFVPGADLDSGEAELRVEIWAADASRPEVAPMVAKVVGDVEEALRRADTRLLISAQGAHMANVTASIAFGVPTADTLRGTTTALEVAPVIMLSADDALTGLLKTVTLRARPPVVDQPCWEHRAAAAQLVSSKGTKGIDKSVTAKLVEHRGAVHGGWIVGIEKNEAIRKKNPSATARDVVDLSLDDPSVGALLIEATPLFAARSRRAVLRVAKLDPSWYRNPAPPEPKNTALQEIENLFVGARALDAQLPSLEIPHVGGVEPKSGEVWEISVRALVSTDERTVLSSAVESRLVDFTDPVSGDDWLAGPSRRVVVEIATVEMPSFEAVRAALWPRVRGRSIEVGFAPGRVTPGGQLDEPDWAWRGRMFVYLREATLARQAWHWAGRPLELYPFDLAPEYERPVDLAKATYLERELARIGPALRWEVAGFGDRNEADYVTTEHVLRPLADTNLRAEPLEGDGRAQHWRFRVTTRSRYAALMIDHRRAEIAGPLPDDDLHDRWQRALMPVAPPDVVKPPAVRVVLPLTQSVDDRETRRPPPLLAVLDDAWFDIGGVAEELIVDVEEVAGVDVGGGNSKTLQEFGPDPIRSVKPWGKIENGVFEPKPKPAVTVRPVGPIGYTFDTKATAPRFAHSSFILEVDTVGSQDEIPDWSFVKLSLRRALLPEGSAGYDQPVHKVAKDTAKTFTGELTGRPRYADLIARGTANQLVNVSVEARIGMKTVKLPEPLRITSTAAVRLTLERVAVEEDTAGEQNEVWQLEARPRDAATAALYPKMRAREKVPAPAPNDPPTLTLTWKTGGGAPDDTVCVTPGDALRPYFVSRPTPPMWAQFAADSSRFYELDAGGGVIKDQGRPRVVRAADIAARFKDQAWTFVRRTDVDHVVRLGVYDPPAAAAGPSGPTLSSVLWVVATERVFDAGRRMTERYVALFRIDPGEAKLARVHPKAPAAFVDPDHAVFRVLEVERQMEKHVVADPTDWDLLWPVEAASPSEDESAARARLTKVSTPIPGTSAG